MPRVTERWEDQTLEEYCIYLETLDPDISPMGYEAFAWIKLRDEQEEYEEALIME